MTEETTVEGARKDDDPQPRIVFRASDIFDAEFPGLRLRAVSPSSETSL
jgi:hypothetical protein